MANCALYHVLATPKTSYRKPRPFFFVGTWKTRVNIWNLGVLQKVNVFPVTKRSNKNTPLFPHAVMRAAFYLELPRNPADVCPLPLTRLTPPPGVSPAQLRERLSLAGTLRLPLRVFLFGEQLAGDDTSDDAAGETARSGRALGRGTSSSRTRSSCILPDSFLPTARMLCATTEEDARVTRAAVDPAYEWTPRAAGAEAGAEAGAGRGEGGEGVAHDLATAAAVLDWSKVDWDADDPLAGGGGGDTLTDNYDDDDDGGRGMIIGCCGKSMNNTARVMSAQGERATLDALDALLTALIGAIPTAPTAAEAAAFHDIGVDEEEEEEEVHVGYTMDKQSEDEEQARVTTQRVALERRVERLISSSALRGGFESSPAGTDVGCGAGGAELAGLVYRQSQSQLLRGALEIIRRRRAAVGVFVGGGGGGGTRTGKSSGAAAAASAVAPAAAADENCGSGRPRPRPRLRPPPSPPAFDDDACSKGEDIAATSAGTKRVRDKT